MFSYLGIILQTHSPELQENNFNGARGASGGTGLSVRICNYLYRINSGRIKSGPPNATDQFFSLDVLSKLIDS
jgi:hypothetical protein